MDRNNKPIELCSNNVGIDGVTGEVEVQVIWDNQGLEFKACVAASRTNTTTSYTVDIDSANAIAHGTPTASAEAKATSKEIANYLQAQMTAEAAKVEDRKAQMQNDGKMQVYRFELPCEIIPDHVRFERKGTKETGRFGWFTFL